MVLIFSIRKYIERSFNFLLTGSSDPCISAIRIERTFNQFYNRKEMTMKKFILMTLLLAHGGTAALAINAEKSASSMLESSTLRETKEAKGNQHANLHFPNRRGKSDRG